MLPRPSSRPAARSAGQGLDGGFWLVLILATICLGLLLGTALGSLGSTGPSQGEPGGIAPGAGTASASADLGSFLYSNVRDAPALSLTDPGGAPLSLASLRGEPVLVFFGYTHCPDVCPATIGVVEQVMTGYGDAVRTLFVTVDPQRDTTAWLQEFDSYRSPQFTALTGSEAQIRATADAWNVKYAKVETSVAGEYSMSHTADVFAVDAAGRLRAHFPFGTGAAAMVATLRSMASSSVTPAPAETPTNTAGSPAGGGLEIEVDSTSIWAGGPGPVILALSGPAGRLNDPSIQAVVQLLAPTGTPVGAPVDAVPVSPPGLNTVSYVATISVPTPGSWHLAVSATPGSMALQGIGDIIVLDPGTSAPIGSAAPIIHSPTLADMAGDVTRLSTDPIPDLRLYGESTSDALAAHQAFVLVFDSARFRVTSACGKALIMARYLEDRWPELPFIHVEPFRYDVVTDTPVLQGSLADPALTDVAQAWGIGGSPWGSTSMPWVFVVDQGGIVRAKYQGVMGSADVDVVLALLDQAK